MTYVDRDGYVQTGSGKRGIRMPEHVLIAEKALGRPLPAAAVVHHHDENKANNQPSNLVICPDRAYHNLLHARMRALTACGNANWRKCCRCLKFDSPDNLSLSGSQAYHAACNRAHAKAGRARANH